MDTKSILLSKTFWVNLLTLVVTVLTALSGMADKLPPSIMPGILAALAFANLLLRLVTDKPVSLGPVFPRIRRGE